MAPVHDAAGGNDVEELRRLLDEDPGLVEAEEEEESERFLPLHLACEAGSMEAACLLLDRGAAINAMSQLEYTPLMRACDLGRAEVVGMLLQRGADPALHGTEGWTTLMFASVHADKRDSDYVAVLRLLLEDGRVPVDARDGKGQTALWWACFSGSTEEARVLLLEGRADHAIGDNEGRTPLVMARRVARQDCVRLLEWYEAELERALLLSKARAVVDATEGISKAPEKVGAKTEAEAQRAREEGAKAYLRGRVERGEALPSVEVVVGEAGQRDDGYYCYDDDDDDDDDDEEEQQQREEERCAVLKFVVTMLKEDLLLELMEGLQLR